MSMVLQKQVFRHRIHLGNNLSTYIACPKQRFKGVPRTNHIEDCKKCKSKIAVEETGIWCSWQKPAFIHQKTEAKA